MKVSRLSGNPIEPEDIVKYKTELEESMEALNKELGRFEKLSQKDQGTFVRRFTEMRDQVSAKYKFEDEWDMEVIVKSNQKMKRLIQKYGIVAFARGNTDKKIRLFIMDKKIDIK